MHIASLIVRSQPDRGDGVAALLRELPGAEIHVADGRGRFVVTVEKDDQSELADSVLAIHRMDGVLGASLVYQYGDDSIHTED